MAQSRAIFSMHNFVAIGHQTTVPEGDMESCKHSQSCSSNICPKDKDVNLRTWFVDEDICSLREYRDLPFVRRQRQLKKRRPPSLMDKLLSYDYLMKTAPKKRTLSPEHKAKLLAASKPFHFGEKCLSENRKLGTSQGELPQCLLNNSRLP
jgi:hypothetical protein